MHITVYPNPCSYVLTPFIREMWPALEYKGITVEAQVREAMYIVQSYLYVARDEQREIGFTLVQRASKDNLWLLLMWVSKEYRRRNIGGQLFERAKREGSFSGATKLYLGTPKNGGAVPFYESLKPDVSYEEYNDDYGTHVVSFTWILGNTPSQPTRDPFEPNDLPFIDHIPDLHDGIRCILEETKIPEALYWISHEPNKVEQGEVSRTKPALYPKAVALSGASSKRVLPIGSLTGPFLAYALDELIRDKPDMIKTSDLVSDHLALNLLPYKTTLHQMLCHRNGLPSANEVIVGPGNVLLAPTNEKDFLEMAQNVFDLAKSGFQTGPDGTPEDRDEYSNLNIACIAIIVQKKFGLSAPELIQKYVIDRLELQHTYVSTPKDRAPCYAVHADGTQVLIQPLDHSENTYTFAMMGMYSCVEDVGNFLKHLLLERRVRPIIFGPCDESQTNRYYPIGSAERLDGIEGSCWTLNKSKCPSQDYSLGYLPKDLHEYRNRPIWRYQAHVLGCSSSIVISPSLNFICVVFVNASGPVDASEHVTNLILQKHLMLSHENKMVDIVAMARTGFAEALWWQETGFSSTLPFTVKQTDDLVGLYKGNTGYDIVIGNFEDDLIQMKLINRWGETPALRIGLDRQKNGRSLTILYQRDPIELGIDIFSAPMNMRFEVHDGDNGELRLTRWGPGFVTTFRRVSRVFEGREDSY